MWITVPILIEGSFADFAVQRRCAHGRAGQAHPLCIFPKNPPSKKSSAFECLNLLHAREARGEPQNPWVFLHQAKSKIGQIETSLILEWLFEKARTHFSNNW